MQINLEQTGLSNFYKSLYFLNEKMKGKIIEDVKQRVIGIEQLLGKKIPVDGFKKSLSEEFGNSFGAEIMEETFSQELQAQTTALEGKYLSKEWNFLK